MKKTYITPDTELEAMAAATIIAVSNLSFDSENGTGTGKLIEEDAQSDALVKGIW